MTAAPAPGSRRLRRIAVGLAALVLSPVAVEAGTRFVTWRAWNARLQRHPSLAKRVETMPLGTPRMSARAFMEAADRFPAPVFTAGATRSGAPTWTTFAEIKPDALPAPPRSPSPTPGVVRIAFVGGSTTFDGYPERVGEALEARFGKGKVEVVNMGVPASNTATSWVLMQRFLPTWKPHLVVVYHGFNDLTYYEVRSRAIYAMTTGIGEDPEAIFRVQPPSRGLAWFMKNRSGKPRIPERHWLSDTVFTEPENNYWQMTRMGWELGFDLYVTTFARPAYDRIPSNERDFLEADLFFLWPMLGDTARYARTIDTYNDRLRDFARRAGTAVIDVAASLTGGLQTFRDNCHRTAEGDTAHAKIAALALAPRIEALLAQGAPPPEPHTIVRSKPLPMPAAGLPEAAVTGAGKCVQGPCPQNTCYVPAGASSYGYPQSVLDEALRVAVAGIGFGDGSWYEDDGPARTIRHSAFCIDRAEAGTTARSECVRAGACPPFNDLEPNLPAVMPTYTDADAFCAWRGGRLPTDPEWEAAARGGDGRLLPWGPKWTGSEANYCGAECPIPSPGLPRDAHAGAAPSGTYASTSPYGAVDMAGNMWEWVRGCFRSDMRAAVPDGFQDPVYADTVPCRHFIRGGGFQAYPIILEQRTAEGMFDTEVSSRGVRCVFDFGTTHNIVPERGRR